MSLRGISPLRSSRFSVLRLKHSVRPRVRENCQFILESSELESSELEPFELESSELKPFELASFELELSELASFEFASA